MDKEAVGQNSATVFRDKSGRRRDLAAERVQDEVEAKKNSELDKKYREWGKG